MKEMNIQFHKTRPQNPFDDGAKARLHRMGLLRIDGSVDEATLNALSRAYSGLLFDDLCDTCQNSCEITEILRRVRIIFCTLPNGDVLLLHGFVKRQKRDTMQALEQSIRILDALREHPERAVEYKIKEEKAS